MVNHAHHNENMRLLQHVEWFLSMSDRESIRRWRGVDHTIRSKQTITTRILDPFWEWCTEFVPATVAPNLLSLAGTTCILQAYYVTYFNSLGDSTYTTATAMFLIFAFMTLDGMDGKHARKLRQQSPVCPRAPAASLRPRQRHGQGCRAASTVLALHS